MSNPSGVGRPTKWTQKLQDQICELLKEGLSIKATCAILKIHKDTYYEWCASKPGFSDSVESAKVVPQRWCLDKIKASVDDKNINWKPATWLLERINREDWGLHEPGKEETGSVDPGKLLTDLAQEIASRKSEGQ